MNYRTLGRTGLTVSEIGLGSEGYAGKTDEEALALVEAALECGINYFDMFNSEPDVRDKLGLAMRGRREKFIVQGHLCSIWQDGQYKRSRDINLVREAYEDLFTRLGTDYIDIGMIHYVDDMNDFDNVFDGEILRYALSLKEQGRIHFIGMSTHNPQVAAKAVKTGLVDVIMMSINPAYDMLPPSDDIDALFDENTYKGNALANIDAERDALYKLCEARGVALTAMKPFAGGALLYDKASPFGVAMTVPQCLHYCLTRPAVATVPVGAKTAEEVRAAAAYSSLTDTERSYADVLANAPAHSFKDHCMYCGHCAPCSAGIDIATVNKFTDLCIAQDTVPETVREHYEALDAKAGDCIQCGQCETNCPFGVKIIGHMKKAAAVFGK